MVFKGFDIYDREVQNVEKYFKLVTDGILLDLGLNGGYSLILCRLLLISSGDNRCIGLFVQEAGDEEHVDYAEDTQRASRRGHGFDQSTSVQEHDLEEGQFSHFG